MPLVQDGYNSSGGKNYRIVPAPKKTPTKTYIYKPSTINGVSANGSTRVIVRDANTGALISDTGYLNKAGTGAGAGVTVQDVIQDQRSGSSPLQTAPDWNTISNVQIKQAGYNTLSEYKSAYNKGLAISPSQLPKTTTPTQTTSQKLTEQLSKPPTSPTSTFKFNIDQNKSLIPETVNQDVPTITELGIYNTEKQVTQNLLNSAEYQATLLRLNKLRFNAEKEAGLKTESRATDIYSPEALAQRQLFYGEEKQAKDKKIVDNLNNEITLFNTNYEAFQEDYKKRDLDPTTPELDLTQKNYEDFTIKNKAFEDTKTRLDIQQKETQEIFRARTSFQEELAKIQNPIIKGYFDPTTPMSAGTTAGITEFQRIETEKQYAGTPAQKAFAGKEKNLLTAVLATPQIYAEQFKQTGTKTTTNPFFDNPNISPQIKKSFTTTTPVYTNIFEGKEIEDIKAPATYKQELEFKKQIGLRAGLATARDPYDITDLQEDLQIFSTDVAIGATAGAIIGTIPAVGIGTVAGATTGLLTGAVGGATNVITKNVVERQTGSEFLGESLGTVTGIGAEILSAGAVSKAVSKTISANPRLIGNPKSIAYNLGNDKVRVIRSSQFKTGTGFLTRKFDVIDDVIIKRSDLLEKLTKEQTEAIFKQAYKAPKYLTDDVFKSRIKLGKGNTSLTEYTGEFAKTGTKNIPLDDLLKKIDVTEFSGVQRISARTGRDLLIKAKTKIKPTIYDDSIESVTGFGQVKQAEKAILIKKGTKTFQFEGVGFSYSQADELAEGIAKAQKGVKTSVKKIKDLKLLGKSKYADIDAPEEIFKLNPKQTTTDLQEDFIFIKGKQKGSRLFTNEADEYSKFIAQTREKGFSKTITFQGDETIISPTTKFKQDILTFSGNKGKGQIIKTSTKGIPDEYTLRIASKADDLPKGTEFTKATVTKAGDKVDDVLGLNQVGIKPAPKIKLLKEAPKTFKSPIIKNTPIDDEIAKILSKTTKKTVKSAGIKGVPLDNQIDDILKTTTKKTITPKTPSVPTTSGGGGTLLLTKTKTKAITKSLTKQATKNIAKTASLTASKTATTSLIGSKSATKALTRSRQKTSYARANTRQINLLAQAKAQAINNINKFRTAQKVGLKTATITDTKVASATDTLTGIKTDSLSKTSTASATATRTLTDVVTVTRTNTDTKTDIKTKIITKPILINPVLTPFVRIPAINIPRVKLPFAPSQAGTGKEKTKLYVAQVREKNNSKWKTVSKPKPYNKAYNTGLDVADNTIAQSVRTIYKKQVKKFLPDDPSIRDFKFRNKKYKSKIPSNPVKIEKRNYAIDTFGEKQGLSVAKYLAQKKRSNKIKQTFINKKGVSFL